MQNAPSAESGTADAGISELRVQGALGTDSGTANAEISESGVLGALVSTLGRYLAGGAKSFICEYKRGR